MWILYVINLELLYRVIIIAHTMRVIIRISYDYRVFGLSGPRPSYLALGPRPS